MRTAIGALLFGVAVVAAAAGIVYSGIISVAADEPHFGPIYRFLQTVRMRSIAVRTRDIEVPNLDDLKLISAGAEHYAAMCSGCHLAPGVGSTELRDGLYPTPPNLAEHAHDSPAETFWIIKHGIKMTGMPAWGKTHGDDAIWGLVAFLRKLPQMNEREYRLATATPRHHRSTAKTAPNVDGNEPAPAHHHKNAHND